jgi:hypothetical protein
MTSTEVQMLLEILTRIAVALEALEKAEYHFHLAPGQRLEKAGDSLLVESENA